MMMPEQQVVGPQGAAMATQPDPRQRLLQAMLQRNMAPQPINGANQTGALMGGVGNALNAVLASRLFGSMPG